MAGQTPGHFRLRSMKFRFIAASDWNCYIAAMSLSGFIGPFAFVLRDHDRLPGRFFGRMTASILAGL
ncbi:hypothetical protein [Pseudorhodoplanes sp.]|uniref:hypothetical protein n=1 Tax=Pseudorhodoplanes sp. TaxID=1934341 RepID=UPI002BC7D871|nr:hypothetical protein [Pseudorhodoplanes sp.]HWV54294.1 hypothetical protein [Pseudorhodoplanes sp.]